MEIREATNDDIEGIRTVARRSWEHDYPDVLSRETITDTVEQWYAPEQLEFDIESDDALVLTAEKSEIVGFAHAVRNGRTETLLRLYVDPDHRKEGIGTRLLDGVQADAAAHDRSRLEAMVLAANDSGNAFYRSYGFERDRVGATAIGGEEHDEVVYAFAR